MFSKFLKLVIIGAFMTAGAVWSANVLAENWEAPTANPPLDNRFRPVNVSDLPQTKTGTLYLTKANAALIMDGPAPLIFGAHPNLDPAAKHVGLRASNAITNSVIWTLPVSDGINGYVLTTNGSGQLGWSNPTDLITQDDDWTYQCASPPCSAPYTSITSEWLTRIHKTGGNAELQIQSGTNNYWGIYQANGTADLRFWNITADNLLTLTASGRVGIATTTPAQVLDVNGGLKLSGLIYDNAGTTGTNNQILSSNGTNIKWIDPTWFTGSGYIYSTQNTRVGSGGTIDYANGVGDLYVQNDLEVDGNSYLKNIFADTLTLTQTLNLGFTPGSVVFQGASGLAQNNSKFFWDNTNNRLGLGTTTPTQVLEIKGNLNFTDSLDDGSRGVIMLGGRRYISSLGKSLWTSVYTGAEEYSNTFIGTMAGKTPIDQDTAIENTAIGFYSLNNNVTGGANTAIGSNALFSNDGFRNVAIGASALYNNTVGDNLTAIGAGALYSASAASEVTAVGYNAGYSNSTGNQNVFFGNEAGYFNSTGNKNVFLGYQSGNSNTTGSENIFIGYRAGLNNDVNTGGNVMIGSGAGTYNYTGAGNVFLGAKAGFNEPGSNRLYIEPSNADNNNALVYGQFYSASTTTSPMLRFNGKVGIAPRGTAGFTPNKLLHIYAPTNGDNAEIDIQSVAGINKHWAIFQHRGTEFLTFWNNNIKSTPSIPDEEDILTLATVGLSKTIPAVGIGTGLDDPYSHLEVRNKAGLNDHGLTISSYTQSALGSLSGGSYGSNVLVFRSGRYKVQTGGDNTYQAYNGAIIYGGFKDMADGISQSDYKNARLGIQTLTDVGGLSDTIVAQNVRVGIAGNIMRDKTLTVHGSTWSEDYWSDNLRTNGGAGGEKGNSGYVCVAVPTAGPSDTALRLRFEDGLYICSCDNGSDCTPNCYCDNY